MNYIKQNHLSILIIVFMVVSAIFGGNQSASFGATRADLTTVSNPWTFTSTGQDKGVTLASTTITSFKLGQAGTINTGILKGTCSLIAYTGGFTVAATTTIGFDCLAAGVLTTDVNISMQTATSSVATSGGWTVESVSASSTAGYIRVHVRNNTGASAQMPASVASSTPWFVIR